jgi:Rap1a immunity proteins
MGHAHLDFISHIANGRGALYVGQTAKETHMELNTDKFLSASLVVAAICGWSSVSSSAIYDGNKVHEECQKDSGYCIAFAIALADVLDRSSDIAAKDLQVCLPRGTKVRQIVDVIKQELERRPERRNDPAVYLALDALKRAWPCP